MQVYVQGIVFTCKIYGGLRACVHSSIQMAEAGLLVAVLCAHISILAPQRSLPEHYPKVSAKKKLPDCLLSDLFLPPL